MEDVKSISVIAMEDLTYDGKEVIKGDLFEIKPEDFKAYLDNQMIQLRGGVR